MKTVNEAIDYLVSQTKAITQTETLPLAQCLGRVLAQAIVSSMECAAT